MSPHAFYFLIISEYTFKKRPYQYADCHINESLAKFYKFLLLSIYMPLTYEFNLSFCLGDQD